MQYRDDSTTASGRASDSASMKIHCRIVFHRSRLSIISGFFLLLSAPTFSRLDVHQYYFFFSLARVSDPFADAIKGSDDDVQDGLVHIRIQQRNGRKTLTTVQGLSSEYDLKKIVRACKKVSSTRQCASAMPRMPNEHAELFRHFFFFFSFISFSLSRP